MRSLAFSLALCLPSLGHAQSASEIVTNTVDGHILPGYTRLVDATETLHVTAQAECEPGSGALQSAFHDAFDAWVAVSHITFGPAEADNRYFAMAFWPDTRGMTGRGLSHLINDADPIIETPDGFATVSVAARGFYALEFLLFDEGLSAAGDPAYHCALMQAVTADIDRTASAILSEWQSDFAPLMRNAGSNDRFQSPEEALRRLLGSLSTGLEFTADLRLGRPMGTFEASYPRRAEVWRSGRSLRHVILSVAALGDLGHHLSAPNPAIQQAIGDAVARVLDRAETLDDPVFAGVSDPLGRVRVEGLQQRIRDMAAVVATQLGPELGVAAGFNSLDGD